MRQNRVLAPALVCCIPLVLFACDASTPPATPPAPSKPAGAPWFEEIAAQVGVDFTWRSGSDGQRYYMPEGVGGGAALFDMDGDGDLDLYLVQGGRLPEAASTYPPNQLYENTGDGAFRDVTDGSGAEDRAYGMGVAAGDYDGDGRVDLYVTNLGRNALLRNTGDGTFDDVSESAGVGHEGWSTGAVFFDYDRDGDLDLFVLNYINWSVETEITCYNAAGYEDYCLPRNYSAPGRDVLYRNEGDGTFREVTEEAGMQGAVATGLGVVTADFNDDGWPDLFVANDTMPDHLWFNQGDGTFQEMGMAFGAALDQEGKAKAGMGVAAADLDDDLDVDLIVVNLGTESDSLFLNEGAFFVDLTISSGLSALTRRFTRFGVGFADFNDDGYLDLYEANGRVQRESRRWSDDPYAEPNTLLRGEPGPKFTEVRPAGGTANLLIHSSRAAAFGDIDNDGGVDIVVVNRDAPAYVLKNIVPERGHSITLDVREASGRVALGARVLFELGGRTVRRDVQRTYSFFASNDPRVHVGLGEQSGPLDVTVQWADGRREVFEGLAVDQVHEIRRGAGRAPSG